MTSSLRFAEGVGALVAGYAFFNGAGLVNALVTKPPLPPPSGKKEAVKADVFEAVKAMYSGEGCNPAMLTDDVTFTDPVARCEGRCEVSEGFRALAAAAQPEQIDEPLAVSRDGEEGIVFHLHQRYFRGNKLLTLLMPDGFVLRSVLVVQTREADGGRICAIEERWNGAPLLSFSAFRFVRRVNGVVSSLLTPRVC